MARMIAVAVLVLSLGGCVSYHQETAALRMPRPNAEPAALAAYAAPDADYPSAGGDILKGTSPTASATYDATTAP